MIGWTIHHKAETVSTNLDAREGVFGDVFTADYQTAGRGRLDHAWLSPPGANLMMSVVLDVSRVAAPAVATLPLVAGVAVARAVGGLFRDAVPALTASPVVKWPNDVLVAGRKIAGILCERTDDRVIVGIGVNVAQTAFDAEISQRATSIARVLEEGGRRLSEESAVLLKTESVRDRVLEALATLYACWREKGFAAIYPFLKPLDCLRGKVVSVRQADDDAEPVCGICGGIRYDGSLDVGGQALFAGEAHVTAVSESERSYSGGDAQ